MAKKKLDILFENDDFIAIDKPSGLLSIADRNQNESLKSMLDSMYESVYTVHRLDRDTSGVILFAKNKASHQYLSRLFEGREINKFYTAVVVGVPPEQKGMIDAPIAEHPLQKGVMQVHRNGKASQTGYTINDSTPYFSLVEFQLFTGRTHQIRVHSKHAGFPVAVDPVYGDATPVYLSKYKKNYKLSKMEDEERPIIERLALHATRIEFKSSTGEAISISSPLPKPFKALMIQLKKK